MNAATSPAVQQISCRRRTRSPAPASHSPHSRLHMIASSRRSSSHPTSQRPSRRLRARVAHRIAESRRAQGWLRGMVARGTRGRKRDALSARTQPEWTASIPVEQLGASGAIRGGSDRLRRCRPAFRRRGRPRGAGSRSWNWRGKRGEAATSWPSSKSSGIGASGNWSCA